MCTLTILKKYIVKWSRWKQKKKMYLKMVRGEQEEENAS
jgi:hypothetical protein